MKKIIDIVKLLKEYQEADEYANVIIQTWAGVTPIIETREEWLGAMAEHLKADINILGYHLNSNVRLSCGWPRGRKVFVGQCWSQTQSRDNSTEIFISPTIDDPLEAGAILAHELVHAAIGTDKGHGTAFKRLAIAIGLTGKMTSTEASPRLIKRLADLYDLIGKYPHASLKDLQLKKQTTRLIKVVCPDCGYTVRVTRQWLDEGNPRCPNGDDMDEDSTTIDKEIEKCLHFTR